MPSEEYAEVLGHKSGHIVFSQGKLSIYPFPKRRLNERPKPSNRFLKHVERDADAHSAFYQVRTFRTKGGTIRHEIALDHFIGSETEHQTLPFFRTMNAALDLIRRRHDVKTGFAAVRIKPTWLFAHPARLAKLERRAQREGYSVHPVAQPFEEKNPQPQTAQEFNLVVERDFRSFYTDFRKALQKAQRKPRQFGVYEGNLQALNETVELLKKSLRRESKETEEQTASRRMQAFSDFSKHVGSGMLSRILPNIFIQYELRRNQ